jgi:type I restriction enzyme, R subunit
MLQNLHLEFLAEQTQYGNQIQFIDTIINYLNTNGVIDPKKLFEAPITDINSGGILGLFDEKTSTKIISLIQGINQNAEVG